MYPSPFSLLKSNSVKNLIRVVCSTLIQRIFNLLEVGHLVYIQRNLYRFFLFLELMTVSHTHAVAGFNLVLLVNVKAGLFLLNFKQAYDI